MAIYWGNIYLPIPEDWNKIIEKYFIEIPEDRNKKL